MVYNIFIMLRKQNNPTEGGSYRTLANFYRKNFCNNKARPLEEGEYHPFCANFTGPGTRVDLPEVLNYEPYNNVDACAKEHDILYDRAFKETDSEKSKKLIREADNIFLECIEKYRNEEPYYTLAKTGISGKVLLEDYLPSLSSLIFKKYTGGIINELKLENVYKKRLDNSYSYDDDNATNLIVYYDPKNPDTNKEFNKATKEYKAKYFGSIDYKAQPYPGDIDMIEEINLCCSREEACKKVERIIKLITKRILRTEGYYFSEFKAGIDERFKINIGKRLKGYNYSRVRKELKELLQKKLLTNEEYKKLINLSKEKVTKEQHELLYEELRKYWLLRWTSKEIKSGVKILRGNKEIKLREAICMKSPVKIDVITYINGKYIEVTNIFFLYYRKKNKGRKHGITQDDKIDIRESLRKEIIKYSKSAIHYSPFKMIKRMWSLARIEKDDKMLKVLTPLIRSSVSLLWMIKSEISTIIKLIDLKNRKLSKKIGDQILTQIENMRQSISSIIDIKINEKYIYKKMDKISDTNKWSEAVKELKEINKYIITIINRETEDYLKKYKII